jgi:hypothetical protein
MPVIMVRPGQTITVVGVPAETPPNLPVDPGYSPPWAQVPEPPVDPGYGIDVGGGYRPPPRPTHPIARPGDPWWGQDLKPTHPIVIPPTEPPPVEPPPSDSGNWVWAWSPQLGRWVWVKVPGEGEAGPRT